MPSRRMLVVLLPMFSRESLYQLCNGAVPWVHLGKVEAYVAQAVGAIYARDVLLSVESYHHIVTDHPDLDDDEFMLMPLALERGMVIFNKKREHWATICFQHPNDDDRRYILAIKGARHGHQIFARSFHRMRPRQTKALLRRGHLLRCHK